MRTKVRMTLMATKSAGVALVFCLSNPAAAQASADSQALDDLNSFLTDPQAGT